MKRLLVVEDGHEYAEFAGLFLSDVFEVVAAQSATEALELLGRTPVDAFLLDLRFDRTPVELLLGDASEIATKLFGGDEGRALRYLQDQQGAMILGKIRESGYDAPAVFVHDFPARRLSNLKRLYGAVSAVPSFDAAAIRAALGVA